MGPGISRWVGLNVARLGDLLHERESGAQGGHGGCAGVGSTHRTADTERLFALVRQPEPDCRRARRRSERCTSGPSPTPTTPLSKLTVDGHASGFTPIPEELTSDRDPRSW